MSKIVLVEGAAPAAPSANQVALYPKADGLLYSKDDAGVEYVVSERFVGARVYGVAQSIANNTATVLAFNAERWDTDTIHDNVTSNTRLTCRTAGKYIISGHAAWDHQAAGSGTGVRYIYIFLNGSVAVAAQLIPGSSANANYQSVTTIWDLAVNDYVELGAWQNSGAALSVLLISSHSPEFSMARIG